MPTISALKIAPLSPLTKELTNERCGAFFSSKQRCRNWRRHKNKQLCWAGYSELPTNTARAIYNNGMNPVRISVPLAQGGYPILCGSGLLAQVEDWLPFVGNGQVAVVSNRKIFDLHGGVITDALGKRVRVIYLPDGEQHKNLDTWRILVDKLAAAGMRRDGTLIALGGGLIGDVAGFAAATYMRGVRLLQMPTTLLAQVDAAIGGKTGVNLPQGKNLVGAFYQPAAVLCDTSTLATLPPREYQAGLAEVVKYALLGDADFFVWLENHADSVLARETAAVLSIVQKSAQMKAAIVAADERETGDQRALLNLGHTFAHAIEQTVGYGSWLHGEAVAAGLVAAAILSEQTQQFPAADTARIIKLLRHFSLPTNLGGTSPDSILKAMLLDKKHTTRSDDFAIKQHFIVMDKIGHAFLTAVDHSDAALVRGVLEELS